MPAISQRIQAKIRNDLNKKFSSGELNRAAKAFAEGVIQMNIDRIEKGLDVNRKPFAALTPKYRKQKMRYIKFGKKKTSKYEAKQLPDFMKLSGELLDNFKYDSIQVVSDTKSIRLSMRIYIDSSQTAKVKGLMSDKARGGKAKARRLFFGISPDPTWRIKEKNMILNKFQQDMDYEISGLHNDFKIY